MKTCAVALALLLSLAVLAHRALAGCDSFEEIKARAEKGDPECQCSLALIYLQGKEGVKKDYARARFWAQKSAGQGCANGQVVLGLLYQSGWGVQQNYARARFWYQKAAVRGNPVAQRFLGDLYLNGQGVQRNYAKAISWYEKAAAQGDDNGLKALAGMYTQGEGSEQDWARANPWFEKAAAQGKAYAQAMLGYMYAQGLGVQKDLARGKAWYQKAVDQGYTEAGELLEELAGETAAPAQPGRVEQTNQGREGRAINLESLAVPGRRVLVAFYSPRCLPCVKLAPRLEALAAKTDWIVKRININRPGIRGIDWESPAARQLELDSLPYLLLLDPKGRITAEGDQAMAIILRAMQRAGVD